MVEQEPLWVARIWHGRAVETEKKPTVETDKTLKRQAEEGSVVDDKSPDKKNKTADVVVEMETDATVLPVIAA